MRLSSRFLLREAQIKRLLLNHVGTSSLVMDNLAYAGLSLRDGSDGVVNLLIVVRMRVSLEFVPLKVVFYVNFTDCFVLRHVFQHLIITFN